MKTEKQNSQETASAQLDGVLARARARDMETVLEELDSLSREVDDARTSAHSGVNPVASASRMMGCVRDVLRACRRVGEDSARIEGVRLCRDSVDDGTGETPPARLPDPLDMNGACDGDGGEDAY